MPNHKSSKKRVRQNQKRRMINRGSRSRLRTSIRDLRTVITGGPGEELNNQLASTVSVIDKAVQKGVLHKNAAARHKSRLTVSANQAVAK